MEVFNVDSARPRKSGAFALILLTALWLGGCAGYRSFDALEPEKPIPDTGVVESIREESAKLARNYDDLMAQLNRVASTEQLAPVEPVLNPLESKMVSISMRDVGIDKLLWALEDQAGVNIVVDPLVLQQNMRASLHLRNVTVREVYSHILEIFDLHGEVRNNALVINFFEERIFNAGLLSTGVAIDLASGGDVFGGNSSSGSSGSGGSNEDTLRADFSIRGNSSKQIDPYDELESTVKRILGLGEGREEAAKRPSSIAAPAAEAPLAPAAAYSLNRVTGSLYVKARPRQIRAIARLIERNNKMLRRQVQVEAQLIDVQLNDDYQFGVDWTVLRRNLAGVYGAAPIMGAATPAPFPGGNLLERTLTIPAQTVGTSNGAGLGLHYGDDRFSATLRALSSFGSLRVLSNPSIRVRNGSPALLSVGANIRYISKSSGSTSNLGGGAATTTSEVETDSLFSGVVVGVVPFIHDNGRIELLVHPMQTDVAPESLQHVRVSDGSIVTLPTIHYKGLTTTLNLGDGDMVMIGGLIDQNKSYGKDGIPGLSDIPHLGNAFGGQDSSHKSRELVVVLRVRLL
ncbi:MAG: pilus (MSHA type) biogenesis protein MshL [Zoogloeaceae bacterium]|jgi:general secretion pathway protein D|nr:pilus (MSHA type) biogenesis protein MshL [Zoogloeaceae bacterium]